MDDFAAAIDGCEACQPLWCLSPRLQFFRGVSAAELGQRRLADEERSVMQACLQGLVATGEGSVDKPFRDDEIDAIVAYMRSWEANPPVELPPEVAIAQAPLTAAEVFNNICSKCHGQNGEGGLGPSFINPTFQSSTTDQVIFDSIKLGHPATPMIGWSHVLSDEQIQELVAYIRELGQKQPAVPAEPAAQPTEKPALPTAKPTFVADILPIFKSKCVMCHGSLGGWDASSYEKVMTTGDHAPVVVPGDVDGSILAPKVTEQAILRDCDASRQHAAGYRN